MVQTRTVEAQVTLLVLVLENELHLVVVVHQVKVKPGVGLHAFIYSL